jgi:glycosyltransferase involved in cell wall biosynthesis
MNAPQGGAEIAPPLPISIFVITKNEARRLPRTLEAVRGLASQVVVVDSGSTDGTQDVALRFGAELIETHWRGYGPQKRFAEEQCRHRWALNLDADEECTPELTAEIRALFSAGEPPLDGYGFPIVEILPGETAPSFLGHSLAPVRLYRLDKGRYADKAVHDRVEFGRGAKTGRLRGIVLHHSIESLSQSVEKLNRYSDQQIADMVAHDRKIPALRIWIEFPVAFFRAYVLRRHFLRGKFGLIASINYAFFRFMRIAKAIEARLRTDR